MTKKAFSTFLKEAALSPEELGRRLGISGMTVRRWAVDDSEEELGPLYDAAIRDTVLRMVLEGRISSDTETVRTILSSYEPLSQNAALHMLGVEANAKNEFSVGDTDENILAGLMRIGGDQKRRDHVDQQMKQVSTYKRFGTEWVHRLGVLKKVITSKKIRPIDKFAAFGALFYLISVFDLIPDVVPVFGYLDDFAVLGIATTYYMTRFKSHTDENHSEKVPSDL